MIALRKLLPGRTDDTGPGKGQRFGLGVGRIRLIRARSELLAGRGLDEGTAQLFRDDLVPRLLGDVFTAGGRLQKVLGQDLREIVRGVGRPPLGIGDEGVAVVAPLASSRGA